MECWRLGHEIGERACRFSYWLVSVAGTQPLVLALGGGGAPLGGWYPDERPAAPRSAAGRTENISRTQLCGLPTDETCHWGALIVCQKVQSVSRFSILASGKPASECTIKRASERARALEARAHRIGSRGAHVMHCSSVRYLVSSFIWRELRPDRLTDRLGALGGI